MKEEVVVAIFMNLKLSKNITVEVLLLLLISLKKSAIQS